MAKYAGVKFSSHFEAVRSRIRRLPNLIISAGQSILKKDVVGIIEEYKNGIRRNNFKLERLSSFTVMRKKELGMPKPTTPLYGLGDSNKNSLINALMYKKIKNGWKIVRRKAKHYKAKLTLDKLLAIHENGALIKVTPRMRAYLHSIGMHLSKNTQIIRIPPRPVLDKAIQRHLRKKERKENVARVRGAIRNLIKTGSQSEFDKINKFKEREKQVI